MTQMLSKASLWVLAILIGCGPATHAEDAAQEATVDSPAYASLAKGTFEVAMAPRDMEGPTQEAGASAFRLDKTFAGDLEGTSAGEMIGYITSVQNSAGYVAIEVVTGTLAGRTGSFVLQHSSTMAQGEQFQSIEVIPDSGTGELVGLTGRMVITVEDGAHLYDFEYSLPEG